MSLRIPLKDQVLSQAPPGAVGYQVKIPPSPKGGNPIIYPRRPGSDEPALWMLEPFEPPRQLGEGRYRLVFIGAEGQELEPQDDKLPPVINVWWVYAEERTPAQVAEDKASHPEGKTERHLYDNEEDAKKYAEKCRAQVGAQETRTVEQAILDFLAEVGPNLKGQPGPDYDRVVRGSLDTLARALRTFFDPVLDQPLSVLTRKGQGLPAADRQAIADKLKMSPERVGLYEALRARPNKQHPDKPLSAAYHRRMLGDAQRFGAWCVEQRLLTMNPFEGVKGVGQIGAGKEQLRLQEGRRLYETALSLCETGSPSQRRYALGVLTVLMLQLRQSELTLRKVRDLDTLIEVGRDGRSREVGLLVIDAGKTRNSKGKVKVPAVLWPHLLRLAEGRPADAPLFADDEGRPFGRQWVLDSTRYLCERAGVPRVCAHALRGMGASYRALAGENPDVIAQALRHTEQVSLQHYIAPGALQEAEQVHLAGLLSAPAPPPPGLLPQLRDLLARWDLAGWIEPAAQLRAVLQAAGSVENTLPQISPNPAPSSLST